MKLSTTVLLLATVVLGSCTTRPVQPRFEMIAVDTLIGPTTTGYTLEYRFATIVNANKSPVLEAIERENINYFFELEEFSGTAQAAIEESIRQIAELMLPTTSNSQEHTPNEISIEAEEMVVDTLLCYVITRSSYTGGAHGMYSTECHTYSLASGDELSATTLFGEARMKKLAEAIRQKLYAAYHASSDAELAAQGFFPEYIGVTDNFLVTADCVTFHYNPYEIGCYALGAIEVSFSGEELQTL